MQTNLSNMNVRIEGVTPLIMHSDVLCNPLNPMAKKMKEISGIRKKSDEHHLAMARIEWEASFYYNESLGFYMPSKCLFATIKSAAKKSKKGKLIVNATNFSSAIGYSLNGLKGKTPVDLWDVENESGSKVYAHCESVVVGAARIMRTRPIFNKWSVNFDLLLDRELVSVDEFRSLLDIAGSQCGLCELRPERGNGSYGRFEVTEFLES